MFAEEKHAIRQGQRLHNPLNYFKVVFWLVHIERITCSTTICAQG